MIRHRRRKKSGHLFEGRYKTILCQEDRYLLELIRYIHLIVFVSLKKNWTADIRNSQFL
jgi:hypothetical protein